MSLSILVAIIILISFISALVISYRYSIKAKRISEKNKESYRKKLQAISKLTPLQKLLKCDALLHQMLSDLGYEGSLGEQLKQKPELIKDRIDIFWKVHKARNRIAHELGEHNESELEKESQQFEKELWKLL